MNPDLRSSDPASGLPSEPDDLVAFGSVIKPHGLTGELRVYPMTGGLEAWEVALDKPLWFKTHRETRLFHLEGFRPHPPLVLATFAEVPDRDAAEAVGKGILFISRRDLPALEDGAFYQCDLEGLRVVDDEGGEDLGAVLEVRDDLPQPHLVVERGPDQRPFRVPFVPHFIRSVDFERREIRVALPPGLMDL